LAIYGKFSFVDTGSIRLKFSEFIFLVTEPWPEPKEIHISALYIARGPLFGFFSYIYKKVKHEDLISFPAYFLSFRT
jgi:hypothetical protein